MPLDARSDLYALGILAFEMLTGNVPFHDENPMTVIQMHLQATVPPLPQSIPYSVQQIVRRALEKEPNRRYQSAGEMMQHCQQVFSEVSGGGASIGAAGVPRTMFAQPGQIQPGMAPHGAQGMGPQGMGPPGMPPGMQNPQGMGPPAMPMSGPPAMPMGGQPGMRPAANDAKTMIAQPSPFAQGGMNPGQPYGMPAGGQAGQTMPAGGGYNAASPAQKTIVAGLAPPIMGGQMMQHGQMPGQMPPGYPGTSPQMPHGVPSSGANKTVMLAPSEGVVSVARTGHAVPQVGGAAIQQGASTLFWIVSLVIGVAVGALAYVIVLQL
jgi:hypothetical protein